MPRRSGFRLFNRAGVLSKQLAFRPKSQSWKDAGFLEYLLLFQGKTHGINEILRASLSISTAALLIAAIFAREILGSVQNLLVLSAK
jgi:hypothetical protein